MMLSPHRKYVPAYLLFFCTSEIFSDFYFLFPFYVCGFWEVQDIFCIIPSFSLCFVICFPLYGCGGAWRSVTLLILGLSKFLQHLKLTTSTTQRLQQNTKKKSLEKAKSKNERYQNITDNINHTVSPANHTSSNICLDNKNCPISP